MAISHKFRTFDQLLEDVSVDFSTYALEGMIEPQQLIKVATRVNYDLGLRWWMMPRKRPRPFDKYGNECD